MAKTRQQKEEIIEEVLAKVEGAKSVVIANCEGLTVADSFEFRKKCWDNDVAFVAVKKTLLNRVLEKLGVQGVNSKELKGSLNLAISRDDEVASAKLVKEFAAKNKLVSFEGGLLEGKFISREEVKNLGNLPSKLELYAKLVGTLQAPVSGFIRVLGGNLRGLVTVLNAIKNNK